MKLTGNEKRTLKLLLENARMTDSDIAARLNISNVAVGKIRKKLESSVIKAYTVDVDYAKLGISMFAIAIAKITKEGMDEGELEVEQRLMRNPHIISVYRIPKGSATHILLYGFQDMIELEHFFHAPKNKKELHSLIENSEVFTFSHYSLIKNTPKQLIQKVIDSFEETKKGEMVRIK